MAMTGLDSFDTSVQKSERWIKEINESMGWDNRHRAYAALRAVLIALRDELTVEESANLSAQLPLVVRGIYYDRWKPSTVPSKDRKRDAFLQRIENELRGDGKVNAEHVAKVVLQVIHQHITEGEVGDVNSIMPGELKEFLD